MGYPAPNVLARRKPDDPEFPNANGQLYPGDDGLALWQRDQMAQDRAMQSADAAIKAQQGVEDSRYPNPGGGTVDLSAAIRSRFGGATPAGPSGIVSAPGRNGGAVYENPYPSPGPDFASQFRKVPLADVNDVMAGFPVPKPEPGITPYQEATLGLRREGLDIQKQAAGQKIATTGKMTQPEARQLYGQIFQEATWRHANGSPQDMQKGVDALMEEIAQQNGVSMDELNQVRAGTVKAPDEPAAPRMPAAAERVPLSPEQAAILNPAKQAAGQKTLDQQTARQFLQQAGGDKVKARQMAAQAGYVF